MKRHADFANSIFAKSPTDPTETLRRNVSRTVDVTKAQLQQYIGDPLTNYLEISNLMNALYHGNGIIKNTIRYNSSVLTLNHMIVPRLNEKIYEMSTVTQDEFIDATNFIERFRIKRFAPHFIKQTLLNGYSLFYKMEDNTGVEYVEFPIRYGRIYSRENGVYRWAIDVDAIEDLAGDDADPNLLPSEIANAIGTNDRTGDDWLDETYFKLKDKGVAFCFDDEVLSNGGVAVSEFSHLIASAIKVENARDKLEIKDNLDSIKLIHSKIPTDKDGKVQMTATIADKYNQSMKRNLPPGIAAITNPMTVTNVALNGSGDSKAYESVNRATEALFNDVGTPQSMFGGSTASAQITKLSNLKDISWFYSFVIPVLDDYYTYEMSNFKSPSNLIWTVKILKQSIFTKSDDIKESDKQMSNGGSRLENMAQTGYSPSETIALLGLEQNVLNIDSLMLPKQSSHTMSGKSGVDGPGRPTSDNPSDDTDRINGAS